MKVLQFMVLGDAEITLTVKDKELVRLSTIAMAKLIVILGNLVKSMKILMPVVKFPRIVEENEYAQ